jgi:hypothetical protein
LLSLFVLDNKNILPIRTIPTLGNAHLRTRTTREYPSRCMTPIVGFWLFTMLVCENICVRPTH